MVVLNRGYVHHKGGGDRKVLSRKQIAAACGVKIQAIYNATRDGRLDPTDLESVVRYVLKHRPDLCPHETRKLQEVMSPGVSVPRTGLEQAGHSGADL